MRRRKFKESEVLATAQLMLWEQHLADILCYRCKEPLFHPILNDEERIVAAIAIGQIEREHIIELALGGEDCHRNCVYSHQDCHDVVTNGTKATTAGSSKQRIAKVKRIQAGDDRKKRGPRLQSRGFQQASRPFPKRRKPSASKT